MTLLVKIAIITLSIMTVSAFPLHRNIRETAWEVSKENQVHDKLKLVKEVDNSYKSHIDGSDLYSQDSDHSKNPVADEMHRKLQMESERLRSRLHQELAQLRERLTSLSARLDSSLVSVRERLAPLTHQLQSSFSSNTDSLCTQLRLHVQGWDEAQDQPAARPSAYQVALDWMSHTLQQSSYKMADILRDFQTKTADLIHEQMENSDGETARSELLEEFSFRLQHKLISVKMDADKRAEMLKARFESGLPVKSEAVASVEDFCHAASLQSQTLQGQIQSLFVEDVNSNLPSSSEQSGGALQGDFSQKLSALIQDILHSLQ